MSYVLAPHHAPRFATKHRHGDSRVRTLPLEGYRQARGYSCGYACALMVVHHFCPGAPGRELFERLGTGRDGTRQNSIVRELRASGVRANVRYDVDFARLCREIDRGKLLVGYLHDLEHWIVIYGYGREPERVFVADPRPQQGCEHAWVNYEPRLRGFGIICSSQEAPPDRRPDARVEPGPVRQLSFDFGF